MPHFSVCLIKSNIWTYRIWTCIRWRYASFIPFYSITNALISKMKTGTLGTTASLKSLQLSPYPKVFDFNIPKLVHGLDNLRSVWINAPIAPRISATSAPASAVLHSPLVSQMPIVASDLRKEMFGTFPPKVRSITIAGKGFYTVAETILSVSAREPTIA